MSRSPGANLDLASSESADIRTDDASRSKNEKSRFLDDVEFLFLTDEASPVAAENGVVEDAPSPAETNRERSVEEALGGDFLFAFDRNGAEDETQPIGESSTALANIGVHGECAPTLGRSERDRLEQELAKLRRELERHRAVLLELRDAYGLALQPSNRGGSGRLPSASDVLFGLTSIDGQDLAEFRGSEDFRSALPKASALLGLTSDGILLQPSSDALSSLRALPAPSPSPAADLDRTTIPRPLAAEISGAAINEVHAPVERVDKEIVARVRWWNAVPAIIGFVLVVGAFSLAATAMVGQVQARVALQDALHGAQVRTADVQNAIQQTEGTFLARYDGRFEYIRARVQDFVNVKNNAQELLSSRRVVDPRIVRWVDRAIERSPAVGWHRLTRAALAAAIKADDAEVFWKSADAGRMDEPLYWEMLADHYRLAGRRDEALAAFANVLKRKPSSARDVLAMLAEVRIDLAKSLAILPAEPVAVLQAVLFIRNEEGRRDWRDHAEKLAERLGEPRPNEDGDDLAARAQLQMLLGRNERAAADYDLALKREPDRNDFRLALAKLLYEQKRFDECAVLVERIVHAEPASAFGEEARVLRNKIDLIRRRPLGASPAAN